MGAINADQRLAMLKRLHTRRECPKQMVKIHLGVVPLPYRTSPQNRHTARHGELNPQNPPRKKVLTRLGSCSEHLDGHNSISPNQRQYEIAHDMVIQLPVIAGNVSSQISVRSVVHPHFPHTLPLPECQPNEPITPLPELLALSENRATVIVIVTICEWWFIIGVIGSQCLIHTRIWLSLNMRSAQCMRCYCNAPLPLKNSSKLKPYCSNLFNFTCFLLTPILFNCLSTPSLSLSNVELLLCHYFGSPLTAEAVIANGPTPSSPTSPKWSRLLKKGNLNYRAETMQGKNPT
ncbi:hypothetical protein PIB30_037293 [Stylosanthes scabra]|uniref:Uncharacterized protein n=1 Tax=Stylosanthes scabra TaxID=79078 RepID=A0ABU6XFH0_9FABA|nr:hypothetical protein [Stylosanthes scabra]